MQAQYIFQSLTIAGVSLPDIGISEFMAKLPTIEEIQARMLSVEDLRLILPSKENLQALRENIESKVKSMVEHVKETFAAVKASFKKN